MMKTIKALGWFWLIFTSLSLYLALVGNRPTFIKVMNVIPVLASAALLMYMRWPNVKWSNIKRAFKKDKRW